MEGAAPRLNNWTEISEPHLTANFQALQSLAGQATEVLAVIKSDAYGHGAQRCAPVLARGRRALARRHLCQ